MTDKENIPARVAVLEEKLCLKSKWIRDIMDERFIAHERALRIQTEELSRRLDDLNGEAERLRRMQATYVSQGVYDAELGEIKRTIKNLGDWQNNVTGRMAMATGILVLLSAMISGLLVKWLSL